MLGDIEASHPQWGLNIRNLGNHGNGTQIAFHTAANAGDFLSHWLPSYRIQRELMVDHHHLLIRLSRHTNLSDLRLGTILPAALLPWILIGALGWVTGLRRHAQRAQWAIEGELAHSREQAEIALSSITDAVITTDTEMRVQFMNPVASRLTGWPMAAAIGHPLSEIAPLLDERTQKPLPTEAKRPTTQMANAMVGLLLARDGRNHAVEIRLSALTRRNAIPGGLALVLRDLSRERELETALDYQSTRDPLTGLFNRRSFETYLRQWLSLCQPGSPNGALCQVDLNHFKLVNDTAGHRAGDELLRQFAWLLGTALPSGTVLARLGADEFGILLLPNAEMAPQQVAEHLIEAARAFEFAWEQQHFNIGASIGLVMVTDARQDAGDLLIKADLACLAAKDKGRNNLHVYEAGDVAIAQRSGQMLWLTRLQEALHDDRFVLYTQPMLPLDDTARPREMHEFLLRMHLDDGSLASPDLFIPAAERYQLMAELDRRVIDLALALVARSAGNLHDTLYSINLSGQSVGDPHLANYIFDRLRRHGVSPGQICFEITETAAITNMHGAQTLIRQLRARGVRFALDDFGAGLSSFTYLKRLPVDFLKIEGEFVRGMLQDQTDRSLVESFCEIGRAFGLLIIAESVEDEATLSLLREIGVDYVQGYHIGRPRPSPFAPPARALSADPGTPAV
ncbi:putative bifunctional diguanylate cyclase/phosphodiesterase [Acidihalobacter yilgarnensis]|uniref:putative bifunctional diguanylate cyclase/phosphodiesterase n=1 Tax=Acidihalobacter yilgarnensis TaxID=2819280 RepID=UPI0018D2D5C1|nr:EAL domain-containing protein [Acidihalobacter yilgarnensis]